MSKIQYSTFGPIGRAIRNAGWLLGGKGLSGVFSLVYLALAARSLGVEGFGIFVTILSYGQAIANIVQFQSWQTVIRYGAAHLSEGRPSELRRILTFTFLLDLATSLLGTIIAVLGAKLIGPHLGWSADEQRWAALFSFTLLFGVRGTATGLLRLFDRFDAATYAEAAMPTTRLIGAVLAWYTGATILGFLAAWAAAEVATTIAIWIAAIRQINKGLQRPHNGTFVRGVARENPGLWRFAWLTNITASLNLVWQQLPVLAVGWIVGAGGAGAYRLAYQLTAALSKPTTSLARAIFPEFAKLAVDNPDKLRHTVRKSALIAGGSGLTAILIVIFGGKLILTLIGGHSYHFAYPVFVLLSIAAAIDLCSFGLEPALIAVGRPGIALIARASAGLMYAVLIFAFLHVFGLLGGAIAAICASLVMFTLLTALSNHFLTRS